MKFLSQLFGPPMAAPESRWLRVLRYGFVGSATVSGLLLLALDLVIVLFGRAGAGGLLLGLIAASALSGLWWFRIKTRRDSRWIVDGAGLESSAS